MNGRYFNAHLLGAYSNLENVLLTNLRKTISTGYLPLTFTQGITFKSVFGYTLT